MDPPTASTDIGAYLEQRFAEAGHPLNSEQKRAFLIYQELLRRWAARINLTAITDPREIVTRHFLDSVLVLSHADVASGDRVADLGTGAGFPGVPVAIMCPGSSVVLFEASSKKSAFLASLVADLGLSNVDVVTMRLDPRRVPVDWQGLFQWVLSRYTAPMSWLADCARPMLSPGGQLVAHKYEGRDDVDSLALLAEALRPASVEWRPDDRAVPRRCFACVAF